MNEPKDLEQAFQSLFKNSASGSGEEELLRVASDYALQLTAEQIKILLYVEGVALGVQTASPWRHARLMGFIHRYLDLKKHNQSDIFIMASLREISLRRYLNEGSFKVNIDKGMR